MCDAWRMVPGRGVCGGLTRWVCAGGFPRACGSVGAPGGSCRFEHEVAGRVVGADDGRLAPARFEASACLVEQRLTHHGYGVGKLRRGAGVKDGQRVGQAAAAQKLEAAQLGNSTLTPSFVLVMRYIIGKRQ